jgi:hypothetical protein
MQKRKGLWGTAITAAICRKQKNPFPAGKRVSVVHVDRFIPINKYGK